MTRRPQPRPVVGASPRDVSTTATRLVRYLLPILSDDELLAIGLACADEVGRRVTFGVATEVITRPYFDPERKPT
jgi:hypothetical protein